ncbi:hypothetical protein [uncultured Aminobacterium sp.]|uniref:hypothetical protein n=2 Tax=Aminobacteriaceae TaxID=3029087 RepID=UPI0025922FCC|nr:hypothetical protein [uncultured Aminobacterium sp.]
MRLFFAFLLLLFLVPCRALAMDLWVSSPWLSVMSNFMGGVYVTVHPMVVWSEDGLEKRVAPKKMSEDLPLLVLDYSDAQKYGISEKRKNLYVLYRNLPFPREKLDSYFADPSVLPFIAQRILNVFSSLDTEHYFFYQRRLAEFQGRLESTVLLGRQLLQGKKVYDLSASYGELLRAARCEILRPSGENVTLWKNGESLDSFKQKVEEIIKQGIPVVYDAQTPRCMQDTLLKIKSSQIILLKRPTIEEDLIISLYDQYLSIWNIAASSATSN